MEQNFERARTEGNLGGNLSPISSLQERLFRPDSIQRLNVKNPHEISHSYSAERYGPAGEPIEFDRVCGLLASLKSDVAAWYQHEYGKEFNPFHLGDQIQQVREKFYGDQRFANACALLHISADDYSKITLPWWSVKGVAEQAFDPKQVHVELVPRHSYETQLMRKGVDMPIKNVSVACLPVSMPDPDHPNGQVMIGLRAGASFAGTMHVFAGALQASPQLISGEKSIYDVFRETEFKNELCLEEGFIRDISLQSHLHETAIENGAYYVFQVQTSLTPAQLEQQWRDNPNKDRDEHAKPIFLDIDKSAISEFLAEHYRGLVADKPGRLASEQYLLHPAALALMALVDIPVEDVKGVVRPGVW
ncbi:MAG: hypothetical protein KDD62_13635 [Bdellovibrionales bacterium]|nr:hypothetical protein [Bdellovibrionales bacterium]